MGNKTPTMDYYLRNVEMRDTTNFMLTYCVKSVHIGRYSGPHFPRIFPYAVRMRENAGKNQTRISPNTDTFYAVLCNK